tara:strand:+ start:1391 stop:1648 length:258 start_codon:yes stop_codon:yes gene_type:complete
MKIMQKIIKWLPLALLLFLFLIDRDNVLHVSVYIFILISYTMILILKILDAKRRWHNEFDVEEISKKSNINKMADLSDELKKQEN